MVDEASVELEGSRKGKRSYSKFSYSKKEEWQKPPKQPRVLEWYGVHTMSMYILILL